MAAEISTTGKIEKGAYINEWQQVGSYWVTRYSILGTTVLDYSVYETCGNDYVAGRHTHSTITHHAGEFLGDVTTREIPEAVNALPAYSDIRAKAVRAWYDSNKALARALIMATYPADFE